jgi:hypothetical protein
MIFLKRTMSKKTDDSIEKFFRKAVSRYDNRFRESDWQKMEQMLDAQSSLKNNGGAFRTIKRAAYGFAALILLSGAVYFLTLNKENSSENKLSESKNSPLREMQAAAEKKALEEEENEINSTAGLLSSEPSSEKTEALSQSNIARNQSKDDNTPIAAKTQNKVRAESEHKQLPSSDENRTLTETQKAAQNNATPDQHDTLVKTGPVSPEPTENAATQNDNKAAIQKPESGRTIIPNTETRADDTQKTAKENGTLNQTDTQVKTGSVSREATGNKIAQSDSESAIQKSGSRKDFISSTQPNDNNVAGTTSTVAKNSEVASERDTQVKTESVSREATGNKIAQSDNESIVQKSAHGKTITSRTQPNNDNVAGTTSTVVKTSEAVSERDTQVKTATVSPDITGTEIAQSDNESVLQKSDSGNTILPRTDSDDNNVAGPSSKIVRNSDVVGERDTPIKTGSLSSVINGNTSVQNGNKSGRQNSKSGEIIIANAESDDTKHNGSNDKTPLENNVADATVPGKDSVDNPDNKKAEEIVIIEKEENKEEKPVLRTGSKWSVFISLAPDFSSTGFGQFSAPGSAYGFQIGYQLFSKISLHTGLIRTSKKYKSDGADYHPPEGYWSYRTNGVVPDKIKGQCAVWEIPLWVQVDLRQREQSRFYVSAGASGYLMTSESYDYSFKTENPGAAKGWSSTESDTYPLAVGHLSAGYERNITPAIGLGIEPFIKIPFGGMGWSKVNLFTTGFYVNVRYRFLKRVSPL